MSARFQPTRLEGGDFERLFWTDNGARDNFRSRLFAMFSEEIVRVWGANDEAQYRDLGRPTLWRDQKYFTLDFTLERKADGKRFAAEQKAELAWVRYSQLRLVTADQVANHIGKPAFDWFLELGRSPDSSIVKLKGRQMPVDGTILVWGATTEKGRADAMARFAFADVLSLEAMLADLRAWSDPTWRERIRELQAWTNGLLDELVEVALPTAAEGDT